MTESTQGKWYHYRAGDQDRPENGSTHNLITHEFADALMLQSQAISQLLRVLGHRHEERRLQVYVLSIVDMYGKRHLMQGVGVDRIIEVERAPKTRDLVRMIQARGRRRQEHSTGPTAQFIYC